MWKWLGIGGVLAGVTVLAGCLQAEKSVLARYDRAADAFHLLVVYQHIRSNRDFASAGPESAEAAKDDLRSALKTLGGLYRNRDSLLLLPYGSPNPLERLFEPAYLRLDDQKATMFCLGMPCVDRSKTVSLPFQLISIRPGHLFLQEPGNLCYYHEMVIPGAFVDQLLKLGNPSLNASFGEQAARELNYRAGGGRKPSWDAYRAAFAPDRADASDPSSDETLKMLAAAAAANQLAVTRDGSVLSLALPMTPEDLQESLITFEVFRARTIEWLKARQPDELVSARCLAWGQKALPLIQAMGDGSKKLELRVDLIALMKTFDAVTGPGRKLEAGELQRSAEMATAAAQSLPVRQDLTIAKIVTDFQAGTLAPNASEKPLKPGDGLPSMD